MPAANITDNDAQLGQLVEHVGFGQPVETKGRPQNECGQQSANHLGHLKFTSDESKNFGADEDECDVP